MTRNEIIQLLEFVISAYPNTPIVDPKKMVDMWEMEFSTEEPEKVGQAVRQHIKTNKWLPKVAEIRRILDRMYIEDTRPMIEDPARKKRIEQADILAKQILDSFTEEMEEDCAKCEYNQKQRCWDYKKCIHNI